MLYQALLPAGLVDQLALITFPVMLGRGKRWYSGDPATEPVHGRSSSRRTRQRVSTSHRLRVMERFAPAALPQNPRAKTNLRSVGIKRRVVGEPPALRPPIQQLHVEGADRAIGGRGGRDPVQNFVCLAPTPFGQSPCWLMAIDQWSKRQILHSAISTRGRVTRGKECGWLSSCSQ